MHHEHDDDTRTLAPVTGSGGDRRAGRRGRRARARRLPGGVPVVAGALVVAAAVGGGAFALSGPDDTGRDAPAAASVRNAPAADAPSAPKATPTPARTSASPKPRRSAKARTERSARPTATPRKPRRTATPTPGTGGGIPQRTERNTRAPRSTGGAPVTGRAAEAVARIVSLANAERARAGCSPLRVDRRVQAAAQAHADDMAARNFYDHASPEGGQADGRMRRAGYPAGKWGENIHKGPKDPATAMRDWMKSPAHRDNILDCGFEDFGVGVNFSGNGPWWVQNFGTKG
ncbi:CAP domain-containing protein [Streptomyces sp. NPDC001922]|uniref:CAP domain-containing protein n=1 Tax=Streptomyces sp. NPDC001922 TaxID=3364624 RepID=UPI0036B07155